MNTNIKFSKKLIISIFLVLLVSVICFMPIRDNNNKVASADDFNVNAKAAFLCDNATGTVIYAKNENERLPIASMSKIMTCLLVLDAVDKGDLKLDEMITISEESASMGGSQVFLDAGSKHKAGDLLKTIIVASANDSCVALGERLSGSVGGFVSDMNAKAKELGMKNTNFANCTGLPAPENFSTAKDVSIMFKQLIKHPKYFDYAHIWLEDYPHPGGRTTTITNTNKLVRFYKGCDGGKTGFTSEAKFCLAATAKRNGMRVVSVIIGADSSKGRFASVSNMFNHAFANYANQVMLAPNESIPNKVEVVGGKKSWIKLVVPEGITRFMPRGDKSTYKVKYNLPDKVQSPVKKGDVLGKAYLTKDGKVIAKYNIVAGEDVKHQSIFDAITRIGRNWNTRVRRNR